MPLQVHIASAEEREFRGINEVQDFINKMPEREPRIFVDRNHNPYVSAYAPGSGAPYLVQVNYALGGPHPAYPVRLAPKGSFVIVTEAGDEGES